MIQQCEDRLPMPAVMLLGNAVQCQGSDGHDSVHYALVKTLTPDESVYPCKITWTYGMTAEEMDKYPKVHGHPVKEYSLAGPFDNN